jgi:aspartyl/asparaginyl beta-hydroxylase (cupin superfamily)
MSAIESAADREKEVDRLLESTPRDIPALVLKADLRLAAGDHRAAAAFYRAALGAAAGQTPPLPLALKAPLERAQAAAAETHALYNRHMEKSLEQAGFPPGGRPPRFQRSLEIMRGQRSVALELQQPTAYYFPGLPQRAFYERSEFEWTPRLEAAVPEIRREILAYLESGRDGFSPYIVDDPSRPRRDVHGLNDNPAWSTLYLTDRGAFLPDMEKAFPRTVAAMKALDLPYISTRAPSVLFSLLQPGARIPAHHGMLNARLVCHLPLVVPPGCGFRVGSETRKWREGELLVFDDSVEHEAWNEGTSNRIIVIFDIWRPELDAGERRAVATLFEVVDAYGG